MSGRVFGLVVGRVLESVGLGDGSVPPDFRPAPAGSTVVFSPVHTPGSVDDPTAFLRRAPVSCRLDRVTGEILSPVDADGRGVWLAVGVWEVSFRTGGGREPESFEFEVTAEHTADAPLDLVSVAPFVPGPGETVVTLSVPSGGGPGLVLGWSESESGLAWVSGGAGGGGVGPAGPAGPKGDDGLSAYQVAVSEGFSGSKSEWLASLIGPPGDSAYEVAVSDGFSGTKKEWLDSLVGPQGSPGDNGVGIIAGDGAPTGAAPTGTLYVDTVTGKLYKYV